MNGLTERGNQTAYNGGYAMLLESNRSAQDFQWLLDLVYENDENQIRYVTTRVTTSRGFVVAYRASFIGGKLGKEEQVPIHAKDVELLVRQQWQNRVPNMLVNNVITEVLCVNALQGAPGVLKKGFDQPRTGSVGLENTTPASLLGSGGSSSGVTAAAQTSTPSGAGAVSAEAESPAISTTSAAAEGGGVETGPFFAADEAS
jgi:hypothetical protein